MPRVQSIRPCLWFDHEALEAAEFYVSIFRNSRIVSLMHTSEVGPGPPGSVLTVTFELDGEELVALNGGPAFKFTEAISLLVTCDTQEEVDRLWDRLVEGGKPVQCGWLKDRYGLSWQVVPGALYVMLSSPDSARAKRVTEAMLKMVKLDLAKLQAAFDGA